MAVTITGEPQNYTTASNPVVFEFSSDETAQDNFSLIVELTVNGSIHSFHQVFPESANFGKFDCSAILRTIVFSELISDGSFQTPYTNAVASYSVTVTEKYGTPPIEYEPYSATSSTLYVTNGSLRHADWLAYNFQDYDFSFTVDSLFLTLFPRTSTYFCGLTESIFVANISASTVASDFTVSLYDTSDVLIVQTTTAGLQANLLLIDASPTSIVANTTTTDANFSTCYYYTIQLSLSGANTELFKIYIDTECSQYTSRRLHWLNKLGAWDSYSFTKYSEESSNIKTFDYQKNEGVWSATNTFDYGLVNGSSFSGTKSVNDTMRINTDWIKEEKHNWLMRSLLESPSVYLEISQGVFEPVRVNNKKYTLKQKIKEGLIQEELTLSRTYSYQSQLS
jgi:hypothetical protein